MAIDAVLQQDAARELVCLVREGGIETSSRLITPARIVSLPISKIKVQGQTPRRQVVRVHRGHQLLQLVQA